jgi:predicted dehydrogenase
MSNLRLGIIGLGKMGKKHLKSLDRLQGCWLTSLCDIRRDPQLLQKIDLPFFTDYKDLLPRVDAVIISTPTLTHFEIASFFLENGVHTFIEKPVTKDLGEAEILLQIAGKNGMKVQVGHVERFNPAFARLKERIKNPRFIDFQRLSPFRFRSADIGVVHDLMLHDLDLLLSLVKTPVAELDAVGFNMLFVHEDIASVRIRFEDHTRAELLSSRISDKVRRKMRVFSEGYYFSIDLLRKSAKIYQPRDEILEGISQRRMLKTPSEDDLARIPEDPYLVEELTLEGPDPIQTELDLFIQAILDGREPPVNLEEALKVMELAEKILEKLHLFKI